MPSPLLALLAVVAMVGGSWALVQPAFQVTDEDVHFSYVHTLGEHGALPGRPDRAPFAAEVYGALEVLNSKPTNFSLDSRPEWARPAYRDWLRRQRDLARDDGGGANSASSYPPAYYMSLVPAYELAGGDVFTRVVAARLGSVLWLLVTTIAAWLLVGELLGRRRRLQLVGAATVGMWPMLTYVSGGVNPDAMQAALWTLAFWLGARLLGRGLQARDALAFGGVVGLALVCKATSLALLPAALLLLAMAGFRALRGRGAAPALAGIAAAVVAFAVPVGLWMLSAPDEAYQQAGIISTSGQAKPFVWREFVSYVWQFYLPRLPFMNEFDLVDGVISDLGVHNTWFGQFFGFFGWTNTWMPLWTYDLYLGVLGVVGLGAVAAAWRAARRPRALRRALPYAAFFAAAAVAVLGGLHLTEYRQYIAGGGAFMQGRYLLPLIGLFGVLVAAAVSGAPRRFQGLAAGAWLGFLVALQLAALGTIVTRFYA